ncbi:signal peptidase I [Cellulomonas sp. URHD0024]|uniref:signal peptidase I n=1 Tax=Cellulomonas sp. URHD0024 TaxID=1302620 RepID=UPI00040AF385|nr:signal peptidase I [Cellulomonas sp. URHD0024]
MTETALLAAPDAPAGRRVRRVVVSVLFWSFAVAAAVLLWPASLGGCTQVIVVSGESMKPTYDTGDLVVARCGEPRIGDVVVYRPDGMHGHVIHRLVGGDGADGWQVQGDNNSWVDPFRPTNADVVGIAQFHLPRVGLVTTVLESPLVWASLLVTACAVFLWPRGEDEETPGADDTETGAADETETGGADETGTADEQDDAIAVDDRSVLP